MSSKGHISHTHNQHTQLEILKFAYEKMTALMISRCWFKCGILSDEQQTKLQSWINALEQKNQKSSSRHVENTGSTEYKIDGIIERLKSLSFPVDTNATNVNKHCLAACAEAQEAMRSQNANSLLEEWQQFADSEVVIAELTAEATDGI